MRMLWSTTDTVARSFSSSSDAWLRMTSMATTARKAITPRPTDQRSLAASERVERDVFMAGSFGRAVTCGGRVPVSVGVRLVVQAEHADGLRKPCGLVLQAFRGGGALFDERGVLLRHLVELRHGGVDLA